VSLFWVDEEGAHRGRPAGGRDRERESLRSVVAKEPEWEKKGEDSKPQINQHNKVQTRMAQAYTPIILMGC